MSYVGSKLGEILSHLGLVTPEQLEEALEIQQSSGKHLGQILIEQSVLTEDELATALSLQKNLPVVNLNDYRINIEAVNVVTETLARKNLVLPIDYNNGDLVVAMANPLDIQTIDDVSLLAKKGIEVVVATPTQIRQSIGRYLTDKGVIKEAVDRTEATAEEKRKQASAAVLEDTPIIRLANQIIMQAVEQEASDIHIEPQENQVNVRFRIDGVLQKAMTVPQKVLLSLVSRIKIMANLDIAEHRVPQDGRHNLKVGSKNVDLRVATIPTVYGENISIRIHQKGQNMIELDDLGFQTAALEKYKLAFSKPYGNILVTGPTGCGKSTTLYATLQKLNSPDKKIFTVEDPVENSLPGLLQVQVNPKIGMTFASMLRSLVRCDPDIIMVGEIRDQETAQIAIEAALTGHLVLSTLHTNDAPGAISRLIEMGTEPFLVSSAITAVQAQRLARRLCENCRIEYKPEKQALEDIGFPLNGAIPKIYKAKGCKKCNNTGYKGRVGLYEIMLVDEDIQHLAVQGASTDEIKSVAISHGMSTLTMDGFDKVKKGVTSIEEVLRVVV